MYRFVTSNYALYVLHDVGVLRGAAGHDLRRIIMLYNIAMLYNVTMLHNIIMLYNVMNIVSICHIKLYFVHCGRLGCSVAPHMIYHTIM